jgi:zinc transport system permease protein
MLDDFLTRAVIAGIGVAAATGPLGCFVVWRRMAYFGDTLAHSALLGVALGIAIGLSPTVGTVITGVAIAVALVWLQRRRTWSSDTVLGLLSHSALACGLIAVTFLDGVRVDLMAYLFGDILAVSRMEVVWIWVGALAVTCLVIAMWRPLVALTVNEETAQAEGVPARPVQLAFVVMIALTVALAMKIVGILLITAMLVIPPATARQFASTPEQMALGAVLAGTAAVSGGLSGSFAWDTPAGPSIVAAAAALFALCGAVRAVFLARTPT